MPKIVYKLRAYINSFTNPDKKYVIKRKENGDFTCNCPSWIFNQSGNRQCKHLRAIFESEDNVEKLFMHNDRYVLDIDGEKWQVVKDMEVK
jgi:predicted nucleic acid-binding Zn finger protein